MSMWDHVTYNVFMETDSGLQLTSERNILEHPGLGYCYPVWSGRLGMLSTESHGGPFLKPSVLNQLSQITTVVVSTYPLKWFFFFFYRQESFNHFLARLWLIKCNLGPHTTEIKVPGEWQVIHNHLWSFRYRHYLLICVSCPSNACFWTKVGWYFCADPSLSLENKIL